VAELAEREQAPGQAGPGNGLSAIRGLPGWLVVVVPALAAFVTTSIGLSGPSLWRDEAYTKDAVSRSLSHLFALLGHTDAVHGAYYVVIHFVSEVIGTSDAALRFPSVCAMAVATGFTAATGRRAAVLAGSRWPGVTGLLSGLLFAAAPYMTYYAQMARSYAFVTMFATIASYLLLRAAGDGTGDGGWKWWLGYGLAVTCTGLFNTFGLLILPAHALTLLVVPRGGLAAQVHRRRVALPWLLAAAASVVVLVPLLMVSFRERGQISWLAKPDVNTLTTLAREFAGSKALIVPVALLAVGGVAAGVLAGRRLSPAAIALPWLVVPPVILIVVSMVKPVYSQRYVEFCLPALAILVAAGITGLARLLATTPLVRGTSGVMSTVLAWAPSAVLLVAIAALLVSPQHAIRQSSARPDNLRLASQIVAANEQPGDVVFYMPDDMYVLGTGYPAPFRKLRDIALAESPIASATLTGRELKSPAELASRFTDVKRVWFVSGNSNGKFPTASSPVNKEMMTLVSGMHIVGQWRAGEVLLTLYAG
jgi:mannosyltransferase